MGPCVRTALHPCNPAGNGVMDQGRHGGNLKRAKSDGPGKARPNYRAPNRTVLGLCRQPCDDGSHGGDTGITPCQGPGPCFAIACTALGQGHGPPCLCKHGSRDKLPCRPPPRPPRRRRRVPLNSTSQHRSKLVERPEMTPGTDHCHFPSKFFFPPTNPTFSPILALFRQVGSFFANFLDHVRVLYSEPSA